MKIIDLFSGLGGASEAFVQDYHEVMRIDNNPILLGVHNTWMFDLTDDEEIDALIHMHYWDNPELIWASPPCDDFSLGYNAPGPKAAREGVKFEPDMRPLRAALKIIKHKKPRYWVIENVRGASKIFSKEMGVNAPRQIIDGTYFLWGNFPYLQDIAVNRTKKAELWEINNPLRKNLRGKIPIEISEALLKAMKQQTTLEDWI
tara:strand:- start:676 stop:1284 length:609 start_codon:yes stop_codon:yes gene_type:complete